MLPAGSPSWVEAAFCRPCRPRVERRRVPLARWCMVLGVPALECVPNLSEGRRPEVVARLAAAVSAPGVRLLDVSSALERVHVPCTALYPSSLSTLLNSRFIGEAAGAERASDGFDDFQITPTDGVGRCVRVILRFVPQFLLHCA